MSISKSQSFNKNDLVHNNQESFEVKKINYLSHIIRSTIEKNIQICNSITNYGSKLDEVLKKY